MAIYRLYLLEPTSRHIFSFEDIAAEDDGKAMFFAEQRHHEVPTELWLGSRMVRHTEPPFNEMTATA